MTQKIGPILNHLAASDREIQFRPSRHLSMANKAYLDFYGFTMDRTAYDYGALNVEGEKIIVQMFSPDRPKKTVLLLHGYLDHVGLLRRAIEHLTHRFYRVVSFDLPGHGLSGGRKGAIQDFSMYIRVLEALMQAMKQAMPGPYYGIGHSTGAAILLDTLLTRKSSDFDKLVLVAPLIRSHYWHLSAAGLRLLSVMPFLTRIRRTFYANSSDRSFLALTREDPLCIDAIPMNWLHALLRWNEKIRTAGRTDADILLLQGTRDRTVDWKYNLKFIRRCCTHLHVRLIDGGRHELLNEKKEIRDAVFREIVTFLREI